MDLYSKVVKEVEASPSGPQIGAFFDFDGTIIYGYSATTYLREQVRRGDVTPKQLIEVAKTMVEFGLGSMGFSAMMMAVSQFLAGIEETEYQDFALKLYKEHIAKLIYPESRALIEAHLKKGHTVAIISAATPYQVTPAAIELGVEHVKCSHLEVINGKFTGAVMKPTCYGMGKVDAAEQLVDEFNMNVDDCFFYSDSDEDIQLLEYVGKPRPLNPNKRLRRIASGRGWPVQDFNSRGNPGLSAYLRTFATQASMLTSFLAGLPIYALTGSMNKTRNFSTSLFADTACALTGLELDVTGEEHAWASRPCVFVFNHQSQADVVILPTLLRRDLAGVGKKEIGDVPILGKLMQIGGTVLIDRENAASARDAMVPLVDVMLKEGRSVCIAPEGTRSTSTNLGRFKKGAFHLAMQAGVPIVPIVIHNAIDVAPRGQFVFRPATVKITVLPAVDTRDWKPLTMNKHVDYVRDMFLEELDQMRYQPNARRLPKPSKKASIETVEKSAEDKRSKKTPASKAQNKLTKKSAKKQSAKTLSNQQAKTGSGARTARVVKKEPVKRRPTKARSPSRRAKAKKVTPKLSAKTLTSQKPV